MILTVWGQNPAQVPRPMSKAALVNSDLVKSKISFTKLIYYNFNL